ncbi:MAG: hypothetical protein ACK4YP_03235, partial [Myxococcota bacterium]
MVALLALAAHAAPCPPPDASTATVASDGSAHVLAADASVACWWIVDDGGDARVAARWDPTRRAPVALVAVPDGRAAVVLVEPGRVRLGVRAEGGGERRLLDLPGVPDRLLAHPSRPVVALVWSASADRVWVVDLDTGTLSATTVAAGEGAR